MKKLRFIGMQILLIGFCELVFIAIIGIIAHISDSAGTMIFPWYLPLSLVFIAVLTALPTLLLYDLESARNWKVRIACHFLLLGTIVMTAGYFFHWYNTAGGAALIFLVFVVVYALVWLFTYHSYQKDDEKINEKLIQNRKKDRS